MDHPQRTPSEKSARRAETVRAVKALDARRTRRRPRSKRPKLAARPRCGARCRDGHACTAPAVWLPGASAPRNGRCSMHGGLSTGPRSPEGRAKARESIALGRAVLALRFNRGST